VHHRLLWPAGRTTPLAGRLWFVAIQPPVMREGHDQCTKAPLVPEAVERARLMLFPHYRDPHSKEGDRPASTCGPFEQQHEDLLHPGARSRVGLTSAESVALHCAGQRVGVGCG
jgi:hypothetical protein